MRLAWSTVCVSELIDTARVKIHRRIKPLKATMLDIPHAGVIAIKREKSTWFQFHIMKKYLSPPSPSKPVFCTG